MARRFCSSIFCHPVLLLLCFIASIRPAELQPTCPSVFFAFGDSFTDTGNLVRTRNPAFIAPSQLPYGITYFRRGSNRFSDGRLIIDCLVQSLGLPFLHPYLDVPAKDFSHGVNYAVGSSTTLNYSTCVAMGTRPYTRYSLQVQLDWHLTVLQNIEAGVQGVTTFPSATSLRQAAYFILTGGNDLINFLLVGWTYERTLNAIPLLLEKVTDAIQLLHDHGARSFIISGVGLPGCSPMAKYSGGNFVLDDRGCIAWLNEVALNYTASLGALTDKLSQTLTDTSFVFLDLYSAFDEIMTFPERYGFVDIVNVCCATTLTRASLTNGYNLLDRCDPLNIVCRDPNTFLNWDGIHFTDNTYRQIVNMFIEGKFITPSNALSSCDATPLEKASNSYIL